MGGYKNPRMQKNSAQEEVKPKAPWWCSLKWVFKRKSVGHGEDRILKREQHSRGRNKIRQTTESEQAPQRGGESTCWRSQKDKATEMEKRHTCWVHRNTKESKTDVNSESRTVLGGNKLGFWSQYSHCLNVSSRCVKPHPVLFASEK